MARVAPSPVPGHFPRKVRNVSSTFTFSKESCFKRKELILDSASTLEFKSASLGLNFWNQSSFLIQKLDSALVVTLDLNEGPYPKSENIPDTPTQGLTSL